MVNIKLKLKKFLLLTLVFTCIIVSVVYLNRSNLSLKSKQYARYDRGLSIKNHPGSFLNEKYLHPSNISYCKFNYNFPYEIKYETFVENTPELGDKSNYKIIYNVIEGHNGNLPEVTYATHMTSDFVNYVPELARTWDGPISIAAFTPSENAYQVMDVMYRLCHCLPEMSKISLNLIYPIDSPPIFKDNLSSPKSCYISIASKYDNKYTYPINVCRNVARYSSTTEYVLVSDIQLIPSDRLASKFLKMVDKFRFDIPGYSNRVFVLPIFEVENYVSIPRNKSELMRLVNSQRAVYFHRYVCSHCQKFPAINTWLETNPEDEIKPFLTVKREVPYNRWEPIFIGTKNEPFYNEVLTWEGLQDKMPQVFEMCLLGYQFIILDGAFLVHWPGIKRKKNKDNKWRKKHILQNAQLYRRIEKLLQKKYSPFPKC